MTTTSTHIKLELNFNELLKSSFTSDLIEAGCDEVGRGCLAGPVVAAAVILPKYYQHELLNDSKQLSKEERLLIREDILRDAMCIALKDAFRMLISSISVWLTSATAQAIASLRISSRTSSLSSFESCLESFSNSC